jgi:hypothetical protein
MLASQNTYRALALDCHNQTVRVKFEAGPGASLQESYNHAHTSYFKSNYTINTILSNGTERA